MLLPILFGIGETKPSKTGDTKIGENKQLQKRARVAFMFTFFFSPFVLKTFPWHDVMMPRYRHRCSGKNNAATAPVINNTRFTFFLSVCMLKRDLHADTSTHYMHILQQPWIREEHKRMFEATEQRKGKEIWKSRQTTHLCLYILNELLVSGKSEHQIVFSPPNPIQ